MLTELRGDAGGSRRRGATPIETDEVTVVVATRNRWERLAETVPHHRAPVILVDNASDSIGDVPDVDLVRLTENQGAAARNVGARRARTPYVAFADDDSYWTAGSLAAAAELMRAHPRAGLLAARVLVGSDQRLDPVSAAMAAAPLGTPPGATGPAILGFMACAVVVRRDAFLAVGGFQPRLFVYGEEALLAMDLAAAGHELSYVPDLVVRHLPRPAGRNVGARLRREARNRVLTAVLRRPPAVIAQTVVAAVRESPRGVAEAALDLPWALRHRRRLPAAVESGLTRIAAPSPGGPS
jgi:N-acetylglucosaminyl-diphospho-decaprenol L-rhamnosyltransferase